MRGWLRCFLNRLEDGQARRDQGAQREFSDHRDQTWILVCARGENGISLPHNVIRGQHDGQASLECSQPPPP